MQKVSIDPITRLEGHGKIDIFLDDEGNVANAYLIIPELRGFEKFAEGRPVEEMARITPRICGVCPEAHHIASAKACDAVYHVEVPPPGKKLRELLYSAFFVADHTVHFYILAAPDFVLGPDAPPAERNILGLIHKVGLDIGAKVIESRGKAMDIVGLLGGKTIHPVGAIPGGVSKAINEEERAGIEAAGHELVEFGLFGLQLTPGIDRTAPVEANVAEAVDETGYTVPQQLDGDLRQYYLSHGASSSELGANGMNARLVTLRLSEDALVEEESEDESRDETAADEPAAAEPSTQP